MKHKSHFFILAMLISSGKSFADPEKTKAPAFQTKVDGVQIEIVVQAPHLMDSPLQTFGVFKYQEKNDGFSGADLEMNEGFKGEIQNLRKNQHFGNLGESLLLSPQANGLIVSKKILVMGLGDKTNWSVQDMERVASTEIRTVCSLKIKEFSHASDVQDGGLNVNAGMVAEHVIKGMMEEIHLQKKLAAQGLVPECELQKITFLSGPKFLKDTISALDHFSKTETTQSKN